MYIEDTGTPFVRIEGQVLKEETCMLANQSVQKSTGKNRLRFLVAAVAVVLLAAALVRLAQLVADSGFLAIAQQLTAVLFFFLVFMLFAFVSVREEESAVKKSYVTNPFVKQEYTLSFYKEFFLFESEHEKRKLSRTDIKKCIESQSLFILLSKSGHMYIVDKAFCKKQQIAALHAYFKNIYVRGLVEVKPWNKRK